MDSDPNADVVTEYNEHPSPTRSAIFNPGATSRINVAHFMARLLTEEATWNMWRGQMPVIYNAAESKERIDADQVEKRDPLPVPTGPPGSANGAPQ